MESQNRTKIIQRTAWIGIGANVFLAATKYFAGLVSGSSAIMAEAANNLTDSLSSIITLVVNYLAARPADKEHPLGHGRFEYLSTLVIGVLILYTGISCLVGAIKSIVHPVAPDLSFWPVFIVVLGFVVKVLLGWYTQKQGKKADSDTLVASGLDSLNDSLLSLVTLASCVVYMLWKINIDGWAALVISFFILKGGYQTVKQTISEILGERISPELANEIKEAIMANPKVINTADLFLDSYGPNQYVGSIHIEVPDTMSASEIDNLTRKLTSRIYQKFHIILTIGIYAVPEDPESQKLYHQVDSIVLKIPHVLSTHGFHINKETKTIYLDVVRSFAVTDIPAFKKQITDILQKEIPDYTFKIIIDSDLSG